MNVDKKVEELLSKEYSVDYWDCYNDSPNSQEYMLEQQIDNSLILVDEMLNFLINDLGWDKTNKYVIFWQEVKSKLEKLRLDNN